MADAMISTLARLRLSVWRRTPNSMRAVGITVGTALALGAVAVGAGAFGDPVASGDLLGLVLAIWLVGWVIGPIQTGGSGFLRPEWFQTVPVKPGRLGIGLATASGASVGSALTTVALAALVLHGLRLGPGAAVVAVPASFLLLALMLITSKAVSEWLGGAARSRLATEITGMQYGLFIAAMTVGWAVLSVLPDLADVEDGLTTVVHPVAAWVLRIVPTGWGLVAVEVAGRGRWLTAIGMLAALATFVWVEVLVWIALLDRRLSGASHQTGFRPRPPRRRILPATPTAAVIGKDLRTWGRDPRRAVEVRVALWAGVFIAVGVWLTVPELLPFTGVVVAIFGAMACVNVYAMDGTALWLTLLTPGAPLADVRGRQAAWLLIFVPATLAPTLVGLAIRGEGWVIPWVASLLPALLGGASGLIPLLSVYGLAPETDANKRVDNPAETGADSTGLYFLMLLATLLTAGPTAGVLAVSATQETPALGWLAVPVGVSSGLVYGWGFGRLAARRLHSQGPELLQLMKVGHKPKTESVRSPSSHPATQAGVATFLTLGMVSLFPQALVPAVMKLIGQVEPLWFVPLHLPSAWQWPAVAAMAVLARGC